MKTVQSVLFALVVFAASTVVVRAQVAAPDLANATLEELMDIQVTSAARKSQRAEDVPAAIYVITGRDIRQSGLMTLPEILRLAPGVQVAQVSASKWAVSIRGFNSPFSNKLLVLIDGRSVYSRAFSGVFWDLNEVMVSDIDRIEVIRGPGGVAWGANAVNGVISIITRPATEQQGLDLRLSAGTFARAGLGIRYGGTFGNAAYRVFSQFSEHADSWPGERIAALRQLALLDERRQGRLVARSQRVSGAGPLRDKPHEGGMAGAAEPRAGCRADDRWRVARQRGECPWRAGRARGPAAPLSRCRGTTPRLRRDEPIIRVHRIYQRRRRAVRNEARFPPRSDVRAAGIATSMCRLTTPSPRRWATNRIETFNTFLQDEISVRPGVALTLGSKLEYDTFGGWGVLPSARAIWEASPGQRLWAAVSRTRRTPSNADRTVQLNLGVMPGQGLPILLATKGNPNFRSERLVQLEVGHRIRLGSTAASKRRSSADRMTISRRPSRFSRPSS